MAGSGTVHTERERGECQASDGRQGDDPLRGRRESVRPLVADSGTIPREGEERALGLRWQTAGRSLEREKGER